MNSKYVVNKVYQKSIIYLILAQVMVAINIVISKFLVGLMPVVVILAIRFFFGSIVLLPLHYLTDAAKTPISQHFAKATPRDWKFFLAQALCAGALFNCAILKGLCYTDANIAGIITSVLPAIIALFAWLFLGEKLSTQKLFCIFFATIGLVIIAYSKFDNLGSHHHSFFGDVMILLALFPEAAYYILCKIHAGNLPVFLTSAIMNATNALIFLPIAFFTNWDPASLSVINWLTLFLISLSSGLFYVFWFIGSKNADGVMASLSTAIMPLATVIFAWLILGEVLNTLQIFGMGLVVLSITLYAKR